MGIEMGRGLSMNRPYPQSFSENTTQLPKGPVFGRLVGMDGKETRLPLLKLSYTNAIPRMPTSLLFGSVMLSSVLPTGMS